MLEPIGVALSEHQMNLCIKSQFLIITTFSPVRFFLLFSTLVNKLGIYFLTQFLCIRISIMCNISVFSHYQHVLFHRVEVSCERDSNKYKPVGLMSFCCLSSSHGEISFCTVLLAQGKALGTQGTRTSLSIWLCTQIDARSISIVLHLRIESQNPHTNTYIHTHACMHTHTYLFTSLIHHQFLML